MANKIQLYNRDNHLERVYPNQYPERYQERPRFVLIPRTQRERLSLVTLLVVVAGIVMVVLAIQEKLEIYRESKLPVVLRWRDWVQNNEGISARGFSFTVNHIGNWFVLEDQELLELDGFWVFHWADQPGVVKLKSQQSYVQTQTIEQHTFYRKECGEVFSLKVSGPAGFMINCYFIPGDSL